ncbi:PD-(D/E)XK nuclease family protein [Ideonella sp. DXS29W]|uniref:PD-(D/E)XK nuclease family protein n=1 Tax=Ideonella lacteola TaxID=2984193 RepID=A0ABU9BL49_9BURK
MSASATLFALPAGRPDRAWWQVAARAVHDWARPSRVDLRDAVWLLPYSALLPAARQGLADVGGWQPRVETVATLRAQLGPRLAAGGPGPDAVLNRLQAAQWLREVPAGAAWARDDAQAFRQGVDALVRTAEAMQMRVACLAPAQREAWWNEARALLAGSQGPGSIERLLARVALEWVASDLSVDADVLRRLRPSGWILLRAGGPDALAEALQREALESGIPGLLLDADPPPSEPFALALHGQPPAEAVCHDAETEAQAACAQVLAELKVSPVAQVALIAQDREAVRRVRALLERFGVAVIDDTGWRLSTTRSAARMIAMLRSAQSLRPGGADTTAADRRLEWLKDDAIGLAQPDSLVLLEAHWRGQRLADDAREKAEAFWVDAQARLAPLLGGRRKALSDWLRALSALCLADTQEAARWRDDPAGRAVLLALRLEPHAAHDATWQTLAGQATMSLDDFVAWVDEVLGDASFVPPHDSRARVVITPMARALLRPFDAVVFPGADERRLGAIEPQPELIPPAAAQALGIEGTAAQRERETLAFAQLLRQPRLTLLRRAAEGSEPLGASALVERLRLAWLAAPDGARTLPRVSPSLPVRSERAVAVDPPLPTAGSRWPASLSASAVEALRACPYRFFSRVLLGLGEVDELDRGPAKRDYGNWLHAVLFRFHQGRVPTQDLEADRDRLRQSARDEQDASAYSEADLLPFLASFEALVDPYLRWLHKREHEGWAWAHGEQERRIAPPALGGVALHGRLDRLDQHPDGRVELLDYKTGSVTSLRSQLTDRSEDTQLAFYAALLACDERGGLRPEVVNAAYLALDDRHAPVSLPHAGVGESAMLLIDGLAAELARLRAGEPMQALGQGAVCEHCEARGLCRRDHWSAPASPAKNGEGDTAPSDAGGPA